MKVHAERKAVQHEHKNKFQSFEDTCLPYFLGLRRHIYLCACYFIEYHKFLLYNLEQRVLKSIKVFFLEKEKCSLIFENHPPNILTQLKYLL